MSAPADLIRIGDHGVQLALSFDDCVKYHGRTSIGGVALGFRLLQYTLARLCPDGVPDRERVGVFTAFPGPGFRDAVEMVTRAASRGALHVDADAAVPDAPEAPFGRLYFEVRYGDRTIAVMPPHGVMDAEFLALARRSRAGLTTPAEEARWTERKEALARTVLAARPDDLFVPRPRLRKA